MKGYVPADGFGKREVGEVEPTRLRLPVEVLRCSVITNHGAYYIMLISRRAILKKGHDRSFSLHTHTHTHTHMEHGAQADWTYSVPGREN